MPRKPKLPDGARVLPSGRITFQIRTTLKGEDVRVSQRTILPSEPASYATPEEAIEGYARVQAYLKLRVDRDVTVRGFWERWLDEDDARWGLRARPKRTTNARYAYANMTRAFVEEYGDRPMASIEEVDIRRFQRLPEYALSQMKIIAMFLRDAERDGLRKGNPAQELAKEAQDALVTHRDAHKPPAPTLAQVEEALRHMRRHLDRYPRSFYGWFLCGCRTGMRGAELDGMQFEYVDGELYHVRWQLHHREQTLTLPKWVRKPEDCRYVFLPPDVREEIRHQRRERMKLDGWGEDYIWLNTLFGPWRHEPRDKWWSKVVGGRSLREICGGVPLYNATRHHWASHMLNHTTADLFQTSVAFGHKDGGRLMMDRYVTKDRRSAAVAAGQAQMAAAAQMASVVSIEDAR
jgi:integrase